MLARRNMFLDRLEDSKKENKDCFLHAAGPLKFHVCFPCSGETLQ